MDIALMGNGRTMTMAEYPQREYIVRETEYPLGCTKEEEVCELVRCKDCKWWRDTDHTCKEHSLVSPMRAEEFCSRGERKDGE